MLVLNDLTSYNDFTSNSYYNLLLISLIFYFLCL